MIDALGLLLIAALAVGPLLLRGWHDRRRDLALAVRARAHRAMVEALGGESYVTVAAEPPAPWRPGRLVLSAPSGWECLVERAAPRVLATLPEGWELVVPRVALARGSVERPKAVGATA
ncbi:MAG TPA: hypothetical protein VNK50_01685 [Calidithermus sp.]|nr:hypothetical protein [Calidithermus sp.]